MKSNYILPSESVILVDQAENKWDVIEKLVLSIWKSPICRKLFPENFKLDNLREALVSRESIQPTNVGHGAAFPHARIPKLKKAIIGLLVTKNLLIFSPRITIPLILLCYLLFLKKTQLFLLNSWHK